MLFSVLIPVYNAENYLDGCLRSVLDQTEQDFEIVLCDDGSSDGSLAICQEYMGKYSHIRVIINQENIGLLLTRRRLFAAAAGEYVLCVDADDLLESNALSALKDAIIKTHADMIVFNAVCIHEDQTVDRFVPSLQPNQLYKELGKTACYEAFFQTKYLNSLWTKAVKRQLIDVSTDYEPWKTLSVGEDRFQSFPLFDKAASIYYINQTLYRYYKRRNSITTSKKPRFYEMRKMLWEREDRYLLAWHLRREAVETVYRNRCNEIINYAKSLAVEVPYSAFRKKINQIISDLYFHNAWQHTHIIGRYRWYGQLIIREKNRLLYVVLKLESLLTHK